jgi:hypothetical protein
LQAHFYLHSFGNDIKRGVRPKGVQNRFAALLLYCKAKAIR